MVQGSPLVSEPGAPLGEVGGCGLRRSRTTVGAPKAGARRPAAAAKSAKIPDESFSEDAALQAEDGATGRSEELQEETPGEEEEAVEERPSSACSGSVLPAEDAVSTAAEESFDLEPTTSLGMTWDPQMAQTGWQQAQHQVGLPLAPWQLMQQQQLLQQQYYPTAEPGVFGANTVSFVGEIQAVIDGQPVAGQLMTADLGSVLAVTLDAATAEAMFAAAGVGQQMVQWGSATYGSMEGGGEDADAVAERDEELVRELIVTPELEVSRASKPMRRRLSKVSDSDMMVLALRGSSPGVFMAAGQGGSRSSRGARQLPSRPATVAGFRGDGAGDSEHGTNTPGVGGAFEEDCFFDGAATSQRQVRSVHLLHELEDLRIPGHGGGPALRSSAAEARASPTLHNLGAPLRRAGLRAGAPRPNSVAGVVEVPRGSPSQGRTSPQGTRRRERPSWEMGGSATSRRIPAYDALLDDNCIVMTQPARLKHLMETRDLPDEYLHIVRARFEQHRQMFDHTGRLGARARPEPPGGTRGGPFSGGGLPPNFVQRVAELAAGDSSTDAAAEQPAALRAGPSLVCSTEWKDSALHRAHLCSWEEGRPDLTAGPSGGGAVGSGAASPELLDSAAPPGDGLQARWERIRERIEALWFRLQIASNVCESIHNGVMSFVSPHNLHAMEKHLRELLEFEAATHRLIGAWLQREALVERIKGTHVLGVNDGRFAGLKADLAKLDRLGVGLVRSVGDWSRRFGHLVVDILRLPAANLISQAPRAVFVWGGREIVERIHSDSDFLQRGELHNLGRAAVVRAGAGQAVITDGERPQPAHVPPPLVVATVAAQRCTVAEPLHEGPPPPWYSRKVAQAGIEAIRRGATSRGGDRRL